MVKNKKQYNINKMKRYIKLLLILFISATYQLSAQTFPVVSTTQVLPPYSVYLSDYASISSDKLIANLYLQDQNQSGLQVKLKITITGDNGIKLETKPEYIPPPIIMYAGAPEIISGTALQQYLEPENLNITGINPVQFARDKKLPEGIYTFTIEAVEYRRNKLVSNTGTAVAWLILNDPPIWNLPQHNSTITATNPQNIFFSWLPMHTGSPNSAFTTEFEFSLYDIIPQDRNPEEAVMTGIPIYQSTTMSNSLVYGPAEPPLEVGRKYAARLKAYDTEGRDMFKNEGYSTVLVFTYGQECITPVGINHDNITPHTADVHWTSIPGNTEFTLYYREKEEGGTNPWYEGTTARTDAVITQLKPEHDYQYLVRALCGTIESEPSEIYEFTTPAKTLDTLNCGDNPNVPVIDGSPPLQELLFGDVINVGGFEGIITQARGNNGVFSGKCIMRVSNFNILLKSHFENIHINQSYQVTEGNVIADRSTGIMINLDDIIADLDSLANIPVDSINSNLNDYINNLDSLVNNLPTDTSLISEEMEEVLISNSYKMDLIDSQTIKEELQYYIETLINLRDKKDKPNDSEYYFTVGKDTTKYYKYYYTLQRNDTLTVKLHYGDTLFKACQWYNNKDSIASNIAFVKIFPNKKQVLLRVKHPNDKNKLVKIASLAIKTYPMPVVKFYMCDNFQNNYFFDNEFEKHSNLNPDYDTIPDFPDYRTAVLGVNKDDYVELKMKIDKFSKRIKYDNNFLLVLKPSIKDKVRLNLSDSIMIKHKDMNLFDNRGYSSFFIYAKNYVADSLLTKLDSIYIYSYMNEKQNGKLKYYCAQKIDKNVKMIYVKTDSTKGYKTNIDNVIFNYLNTKSLNQLFINVVREPSYNLDLSANNIESYLSSHSSNYSLGYLSNLYENITHDTIDTSPNDIFFITNYKCKRIKPDGTTETTGGAHRVNKNGGVLFLSSILDGEATAHELGHWLGFFHPFEENISKLPAIRRIGSESSKGKTQNNFMDYYNENGRRKSWFQYQLWIIKKNTDR